MSWRILNISKQCKLSVKNSQLYYQPFEEQEITIPIEDISVIILEAPHITVTSSLLSKCAEYGIAFFTCDSSHSPNGVMIPFFQHSRNTEIAFLQSEWSEPFKKRLWQKIIQQKITNQSFVIQSIKGDNDLLYLVEKVQSGDSTNLESFASRTYWSKLFDGFKRHAEDGKNFALNYGYAILRGSIARYIASTGMIPCFGIHHCNNLNAFNLADDLIEPFRPFVDLKVYNIFKDRGNNASELKKEDKTELLSILTDQCLFKNEQVTLLKACELVCHSLVNCTKEKNYELIELPEFIS